MVLVCHNLTHPTRRIDSSSHIQDLFHPQPSYLLHLHRWQLQAYLFLAASMGLDVETSVMLLIVRNILIHVAMELHVTQYNNQQLAMNDIGNSSHIQLHQLLLW